MNTLPISPAVSAEALATNFIVAELEPRLENAWIEPGFGSSPQAPGAGSGPRR